MVLAQELPNVFDRIQFGQIGRQGKQAAVFWEQQLAAIKVEPAGEHLFAATCFSESSTVSAASGSACGFAAFASSPLAEAGSTKSFGWPPASPVK